LSSTSTSTPAARKVVEPDLITRYNLQSKISSKGKEKAEESPPAGWASSKDVRQQILQRRRDEMILAARRRMQDKDEEGAGNITGFP
jgi:coupling of ubiquitin conjugation to ER degradation protein 1